MLYIKELLFILVLVVFASGAAIVHDCRKSGLSGRHAFSAWFIEDFL